MIFWYRAVCYKHKETIDLFVDSPSATARYLGKNGDEIKSWLLKHHGCNLDLVTEANMDKIWNAGCWDPIRKLPPSADPSKTCRLSDQR